mgnify:CR=1 FL=1
MKPIASFPEERLRAVRGVFTDIDDTITNDGRLTARAYGAMERLQNAGVAVVPITGRPAGWCDHIARMWPVDGVVGENGAFYFRYDRANRRMDRRYVDPDDVRDEKRWRLKELGEQIVRAVPGAAISADQLYRETDLAVDFCEDVPPLSAESIDASGLGHADRVLMAGQILKRGSREDSAFQSRWVTVTPTQVSYAKFRDTRVIDVIHMHEVIGLAFADEDNRNASTHDSKSVRSDDESSHPGTVSSKEENERANRRNQVFWRSKTELKKEKKHLDQWVMIHR